MAPQPEIIPPDPASRPHRLALVTPEYSDLIPGEIGGLGRYARLAAESLAAQGWAVDLVYTGRNGVAGELAPGIRLMPVRLPSVHWHLGAFEPFIHGLSLMLAVRRLDAQSRYTAVECGHRAGLGWALALMFGDRFFLRFHTSDTQHLRYNITTLSPNERAAKRWDRITARLAAHRVANSRAHAVEMAEETRIDPARFEVVHHGTPDPLVSGSSQQRRDRILFLGAMESRKGTDLFIKASAVPMPQVDGRWTAIGRWPERYANLARECGARVELLGAQSNAALHQYWEETRCVVVPSRYESFGLVAIEALSRGLPVIVPRGGALEEVVGSAGVLVDPERPDQIASAVAALWNDLALEQSLQRAARDRFLSQFTLARFGERLAQLFLGSAATGAPPC